MIRVEKEALSRAIQLPCSLANGGGNLAMMNSVLIRKSAGALEITGTDLEQTITSSMQDVDGDIEPFVVDSRRLSSIVRAADNNDIDIRHSGAELRIKTGDFIASIPTMAAQDFPTITNSYEAETTLPGELIAGIRGVSQAMPSNDIRYYLNGLHIEAMAGNITAVATDGHRISYVTRQTGDDIECSIIVPKRAVGAIEHAKKEILFAINPIKTAARFRFSGTSIETKLIDSRYPDWRKAVNPSPTEWATVEVRRLQTATGLMLASTPRDTNDMGASIEIAAGSMKLRRVGGPKGQAESTIAIDGGLAGKVKLNILYLHEMAKSATADRVQIAVSSAGLFFMTSISDEQEWVHAVIGMR